MAEAITIDQNTREELRYLVDTDSGDLMDFNLQVGDGAGGRPPRV
jgi:hypothetical protein